VWFKASPGKQFCETLDRKNPSQEGVDGMTQSIDSEFKYQYCKKKKKGYHCISMEIQNFKAVIGYSELNGI
jgi:hypothetical protein